MDGGDADMSIIRQVLTTVRLCLVLQCGSSICTFTSSHERPMRRGHHSSYCSLPVWRFISTEAHCANGERAKPGSQISTLPQLLEPKFDHQRSSQLFLSRRHTPGR